MEKLLLLPLALLLFFCNGTSNSAQTTKSPDQVEQSKAQEQQAPLEQGIAGKVLWQSGNQMPSPDAPPSKGKGVQRTVYVYQLTNGAQASTTDGVFHTNIQTDLVTQVQTDANGNFAVSLKPGRYSLFTKEEKGLYANLFDGENNIYPVEVEEGQVTSVEFLINYEASY
ncbi:hypothetical protein GCM10023188_26810 [Pontibacter saemangeumensis]|uniref:Carboxypeptidase regulatory-like domain-containing protein n=1 Tax=Pontibacter saemangeumensis TaxID=1084525 RepID=A0ABP8LS59_9BACT